MPFAKVGAMPQPSTTTSSKRDRNNARGGVGSKQHRPKGITMEDLKKQTALRLAQEQNQVNGDFSQAAIVPTPLSLPTHQPLPSQHVPHRGQLYPRSDGYHADGYSSSAYPSHHQPLPPPPSMTANPHHHQNPHASVMRHSIDRPSAMSSQQQQQYPPSSLVQQHPGGYAASGYGSYTNAMGGSHEHGYGVMTPSLPGSSMSAEQSQSAGSSTLAASNNIAKNKLPHGLTVHELKEMTKARLQAEAAEKIDGELQRERGVSPLDFEVSSHGGPGRDRALSRDSAGRSNPLYHQHSGDGFSRHVGHSPTPRQVNRTDTWDSASVASFNSNTFSENLGSDAALDVSFDLGTNRARSFTVPTLPSTEGNINRGSLPNTTYIPVSRGAIGTPVFDAAVGGNRRRAVTLSPGSILEDRPHHGTWTGDRLQLPSFGSSLGTTPSVQARQQVYSPVLEHLGLDGPFARERSEDSAIGSNLFGSNVSDFQSTSFSSSEFTRESSGAESRVPAPPPGFLDSEKSDMAAVNHEQRLTTFSPHESSRDAFVGSDKNPWGADQRPRVATVENLTSDLGSILNLSGSERENRNRANTFTFGSNLPMSMTNNGSNAIADNYGMDSLRY